MEINWPRNLSESKRKYAALVQERIAESGIGDRKRHQILTEASKKFGAIGGPASVEYDKTVTCPNCGKKGNVWGVAGGIWCRGGCDHFRPNPWSAGSPCLAWANAKHDSERGLQYGLMFSVPLLVCICAAVMFLILLIIHGVGKGGPIGGLITMIVIGFVWSILPITYLIQWKRNVPIERRIWSTMDNLDKETALQVFDEIRGFEL